MPRPLLVLRALGLLAALGVAGLFLASCLQNPPGTIVPCPPPLFRAVTPFDGAVDVPLDANLSIDLRTPFNPSVLPPGTFVLTLDGDTVPGVLTYNPFDTSLVFNPTDSLLPDTTYTVIFTPELDDPVGNPLDTVMIWTFTTVDPPGSDWPDFPEVDVFPNDSATDVPVDVPITVTFDTPLDTAWLDTNAVILTLDGDTIPGVFTFDDTTLVFDPVDSLLPETTYTVTVTVPTDSQSVMGPVDTTFTWTFTTTDSLPKGPNLEYPGDGHVNIPNAKLWWYKVTSATSYDLQVSPNAGFSPAVVNASGITGSSSMFSYQTVGLAANTTYYWRVRAANSWGTGPWSTVWSFKTKP